MKCNTDLLPRVNGLDPLLTTIWPCHIACPRSAIALPTTSTVFLSVPLLLFSKLLVHSSWPSQIEFKSYFSPSRQVTGSIVAQLTAASLSTIGTWTSSCDKAGDIPHNFVRKVRDCVACRTEDGACADSCDG